MNFVTKRGLLILSVASTMIATFSSTVVAAPEGTQQYYCNGSYGDNSDRGLWDQFFSAPSKEQAKEKAQKQYKLDTPGAFVNIEDCKPYK